MCREAAQQLLASIQLQVEAEGQLQGEILGLKADLVQRSEREAALADDLRAAIEREAESAAAAELSRLHEAETAAQVRTLSPGAGNKVVGQVHTLNPGAGNTVVVQVPYPEPSSLPPERSRLHEAETAAHVQTPILRLTVPWRA